MKLFVTEAYSPESLACLKSKPEIKILSSENKHEAEILLTRSQTKITEKFLNEFRNLKLIVSATSGFDHLNWKLCQERGIKTAYCPDANAEAAAEHSLFLILSLFKKANQQYRSIRGGLWKDGIERPDQMSEKTIGIIGLGRIGKRVARLCQAFGSEVIAHDPYQEDVVFNELKIERKGFTEILKQSDLISLHVPLTKETLHMLNASTISEMPTHSYLVNASRGLVIEENDLVTALKQKKISGAALDVFSKEPLDANSFLLREPNLFLTPHTGAYSTLAWEKASMEAAQKAYEFSLGKKISDLLPLSSKWFDLTLSL